MRQELALQPPELAGRDKLLKDAAIDMDRVLDRHPTKGMILLGFRGVCKTVLLNRLHSMAEQKGLRTAKVEAPEGGMLPQLLTIELRQVLYSLDLQAGTESSPSGPSPPIFRCSVQGQGRRYRGWHRLSPWRSRYRKSRTGLARYW